MLILNLILFQVVMREMVNKLSTIILHKMWNVNYSKNSSVDVIVASISSPKSSSAKLAAK